MAEVLEISIQRRKLRIQCLLSWVVFYSKIMKSAMRTRIIFLIIALLLTNAFTFAQTGKSGYGFSIDIGYDMNANKNNSERLEISTTARKYVTSLAKCLPC
jgi:hypothetical protein